MKMITTLKKIDRRPLHPRDRLKRAHKKIKENIKNEIKMLKK